MVLSSRIDQPEGNRKWIDTVTGMTVMKDINGTAGYLPAKVGKCECFPTVRGSENSLTRLQKL